MLGSVFSWHGLIPSFVAQSLVQARKAGIASAMASRSSIKDEELVRKTLKVPRPSMDNIFIDLSRKMSSITLHDQATC